MKIVLIRGSKINQRRKCCAFLPVVMVDSCFERCSDVCYKTVCVVLPDDDFTPIKNNNAALYKGVQHLFV